MTFKIAWAVVFLSVFPHLSFGGGAPALDPDVFQKEIQKTLKKIPEFIYLMEKAKKHNLKIWLFG